MEIRKQIKIDWSEIWKMLQTVFQAGDTYAYAPDISESDAHKVWVESPQETYVAVDDEDNILGTYYIKANQPGLGSHVCNCGYIVSESARGKGVASAMCDHSQKIAVELGFKAMQYNLVVSTNEGAIRLWEKLGFHIIGKLPNAFQSKTDGYVDALVMYKEL